MMLVTRLSILILFLLIPEQLLAHKINVFAWVSGDTVTVESSFAANRPLIQGTVTVSDAKSKTLLLEGKGDKKGIFTFTIPPVAKQQAMDLLIVVAGSEGHQNQWLIPATEYLSETPSPASSPQPAPSLQSAPISTAMPADITDATLKQMLQEAIREELAPIRRNLAMAQERKPGFLDIMGGMGYLIGLAGLVAWIRNRPRPDNSKQ